MYQDNKAVPSICRWIVYLSTFIFGITFAQTYHPIALGIFIAMMAMAWFTMRQAQFILICFIIFLLGFFRLHLQVYQHKAISKPLYGTTMNVQGEILSIESAQHPLYRSVILLQVHEAIKKDGQMIKTFWRLQCYTKDYLPFMVGDCIRINNAHIGTPSDSFALHLLKEHIHATTFIKHDNALLARRPKLCINRTLDQWRCTILKRIRLKCSRQTFVLISSIFFGNRTIVKQEYTSIKHLFDNWGLAHFLARSGLHLIICIYLLQLLLSLLPLPWHTKQSALIIATIIYATCSWSSLSFARAYLSFFWYKGCQLFNLQAHMLYGIILLAFTFLLAQPSLLFFLDFQLSFGLTGVIILTQHLDRMRR